MKYESQKDYLEERAAIREYDGGFSREEAERLANHDLKNRIEHEKVFRLKVQSWDH